MALLTAVGCSDVRIRGYTPVTVPIDGESELHISTYPAGFPNRPRHVPFLYERLETPSEVWFQVFVRDAEREAGPNPHVESICMHSVSYRFPGLAPVELLSVHDAPFWQQAPEADGPADGVPVPWGEGWHLQVRVEFTLNGRDHVFDERVEGTERRILQPMILKVLE